VISLAITYSIVAVRRVMPERCPLFLRISCTDWVEGGWTIDESVELARRLKGEGVDLIDCSSGGGSPKQVIPVGAGFQVPFAERILIRSVAPTRNVWSTPVVLYNSKVFCRWLAKALFRGLDAPV